MKKPAPPRLLPSTSKLQSLLPLRSFRGEFGNQLPTFSHLPSCSNPAQSRPVTLNFFEAAALSSSFNPINRFNLFNSPMHFLLIPPFPLLQSDLPFFRRLGGFSFNDQQQKKKLCEGL